jgi:hypothetical protein
MERAIRRPPHGAEGWSRLERWGVVLIALHSYAVGLLLLGFTRWGLQFGGWSDETILFFPRQAGAFHFVVATIYLAEYLKHRTVYSILITKGIATVFLVGTVVATSVPWAVATSGSLDALMAIAVYIVHRRARPGRP